MQDRLFSREAGSLAPHEFAKTVTTDLLRSFGFAQDHRFDGASGKRAGDGADRGGRDIHDTAVLAHGGGANSLAIEKFDGKM